MNGLHDAIHRISGAEGLDVVADRLGAAVKRVVPHGAVKDALSGTWLGHSLHPMLTDIPIGSFTSATVLDVIGGRRSRDAADVLVALGVVSALPTALAGAADWSDTFGEDQRIGTVHALANAVGLALYAASLRPRRRGRRATGTLLGLAGMGAMTVGGFLGGELSYTRGVGVNELAFTAPPDDWWPVLAVAELAEGAARTADAGGVAVLLHRRAGRVHAITNRCSHAGGPLDEGRIDADACTVRCPWHQSVFGLDDGAVVHGPATAPQIAFDARIRDGQIEVRPAAGSPM